MADAALLPRRPWAPLVVFALVGGFAGAWAVRGRAQAAPTGEVAATDGRAIYARCQACHGVDGTGLPGYAPGLMGNAVALGDPAVLARHLLMGSSTVRPGQWSSIMPPFAAVLNDHEIAAVATWIRSQWGNRAPPVSPQVVATQRARLVP